MSGKARPAQDVAGDWLVSWGAESAVYVPGDVYGVGLGWRVAYPDRAALRVGYPGRGGGSRAPFRPPPPPGNDPTPLLYDPFSPYKISKINSFLKGSRVAHASDRQEDH